MKHKTITAPILEAQFEGKIKVATGGRRIDVELCRHLAGARGAIVEENEHPEPDGIRSEPNQAPVNHRTTIDAGNTQKKSRRERSIAIALALAVLVVLFFAVTMVKGPAVLVRPM